MVVMSIALLFHCFFILYFQCFLSYCMLDLLLIKNHYTNPHQGCWNRGARGAMPPNVRGGQSIIWSPQNLGGLGPLGLVFFTLENVSCLLFESAIPGGKSITLITSCNGYRPRP